MRTVHYERGLPRKQIIWIHPQVATPTTLHIQRSPRVLVHMHDQHHPAGIQATTTTPGSMNHSTNNNQTLQNGKRQPPRPTTRWFLALAWPMSTSIANKVNQDPLWRAGGQHIEIPSEHKIVDVQRRRTILVAEHNNLPEVETLQSINEETLIIRPRIQQYTFAAFVAFAKANMHLVVADDQGYEKATRSMQRQMAHGWMMAEHQQKGYCGQ